MVVERGLMKSSLHRSRGAGALPACKPGRSARLHQLNYLVAAKTLSARECQKLVDLEEYCASLWCANYTDAATSSEVEQPFLPQDMERSDHGVLVDPHDGSDIDGRREAFTRRRFSVGDGAADLGGYLLVQGQRLALVNLPDSDHTVLNSIIRERSEVEL